MLPEGFPFHQFNIMQFVCCTILYYFISECIEQEQEQKKDTNLTHAGTQDRSDQLWTIVGAVVGSVTTQLLIAVICFCAMTV